MLRLRLAPAVAAGLVLVSSLLSAVPPASSQTTSTNPVAFPMHRWMGDLAGENPEALEQPISQFVLPGSHDAGTYDLKDFEGCAGCSGADLLESIRSGCQSVQDAIGNGISDALNEVNDFFGSAFPPVQVAGPDFGCDGDNLTTLAAAFLRPWAAAQHDRVLVQLQKGARSFDFRFFRAVQADSDRTSGQGQNQLEVDKFYIHHTLAGSSSDEILDDIRAFLSEPLHAGEVVHLAFSSMRQDADAMPAGSLRAFYEHVYARLGDVAYIAPYDVANPAPTLAALLAAGAGRPVVVMNGPGRTEPSFPVTCVSGSSCFTRNLLWPAPHIRSFYGSTANSGPVLKNLSTGGYPTADKWNTEEKMFLLLEDQAAQRPPDPESMFQLVVPFGFDESGTAAIRSFVCPLLLALPTEVYPDYCGALNKDWDTFASLRAMADWTNPKILPALVGLPRENVNIVQTDHYPEWFSAEAKRLNKGAARFELLVRTVQETKCHDCAPFVSQPDYYPVMGVVEAEPATGFDLNRLFGWRHLEQTGNLITPNWHMRRSVDVSAENAAYFIQIWDRDWGLDVDDQSYINGKLEGANPTFTNTWKVADCVTSGSDCPDFGTVSEIEGQQYQPFPLPDVDGSRVTFSVSVCKWEDCPPPVPRPTADPGGPYEAVHEGTTVKLDGRGSRNTAQTGSDGLQYQWTVVGDGVTIDNPSTDQPTVTVLDGLSQADEIVVTLTVTDTATSKTKAVALSLSTPNVAPTAVFTNESTGLFQCQAAPVKFSNSFDPSSVDVTAGFTYSYDCDNDGTPEANGLSASDYRCTYATPGSRTARGRISDKDGGFTDYTVNVSIETAQQAAQALSDNIGTNLRGPGQLRAGRANSLQTKLRAVIGSLNRQNPTPAINTVRAFIQEVNAAVKGRVLSSGEGQTLTDAATALIECIRLAYP